MLSILIINWTEGGTESQPVLASFGFIFSVSEQLASLVEARKRYTRNLKERGRASNSQVEESGKEIT